MDTAQHFDVIVIGSGTCGALIARDLSRAGARVLLLERGGDPPARESVFGFASMADQVPVARGLKAVRAITTGGSSAIYFGVADSPPLDAFRALGIDLTDDLAEIRREFPIAPLPESSMSEKTLRLRDAARGLGLDWHSHDMLVDQSRAYSGYDYAALWKAKTLVDEAVVAGATLTRGARVNRILSEGERAIGVAYTARRRYLPPKELTATALKIVLCAGELASPAILRDSGLRGVGEKGFYCSPGYALYGIVPGMNSGEGFVGTMGCVLDDGIELGDANVPRLLHRLMMLGKFKPAHLMAYPATIGIGVKVKDGLGGGFTARGSFSKTFCDQEMALLSKGEQVARTVLEHCGATRVFNVGLSVAGRVGGMVRIGEHLDTNLQTRLSGLHVCDGSVIPDAMRGTPTVTLLSLSRYLVKRLASSS